VYSACETSISEEMIANMRNDDHFKRALNTFGQNRNTFAMSIERVKDFKKRKFFKVTPLELTSASDVFSIQCLI
jgi:hypothetical protein